jgi:DNA-binding transcriptional ArsR family regulator
MPMNYGEDHIRQIDIRQYSGNENLLSREQGRRIFQRIEQELRKLPEGGVLLLDLRNISYATAACLIEVLSILDVPRERELQDKYIVLKSDSRNRDLNACLTLALKENGKAILWVDEKGNCLVLGELTKAQRDTLEIIRNRREATSTEISKLLNIPINAASNRLKDLYDMKLVKREERILPGTGGRQFVYRRTLC